MADTAIQMLLKRLRGEGIPIPYAPIPDLGPLSTDTSAAFAALSPEPVLPRFAQPSAPDANFVGQYAGAAPTAPAINDPTLIDKLAAILGGVAYGPQYGMALKEERQRPIREYEQQRERYEGRRTRGLELAERRAEREAAQANRASELAYERDYNMWLKKNGVREGAAAKQAEYAFRLLQDARRNAETERKERVLLRRQIALQIDDRIKAYRDQGAKEHSEELARNDFRMALEQLGEKVSPLSAAASKANTLVQAKIQRALRLAQGGGRGGGGASAAALKVAQEIQTVKDKMIEAEAKGDKRATEQLILRAKAAFRRAARYPEIEAGFDASGKWPYVKMRTPQGSVPLPGYGAPQATAPQGQQNDPGDFRRY